MDFGELIGNESLKKQLSADIDAGRFPHALLLEGTHGSGRRLLADRIARAACCTGAGHHPCGQCSNCLKTEHPDITILGGDSGSISVDSIRELRQEAYVMPNEAPYRVMILANAENMSVSAQNALLKILEEPPRHLIFILTCENRAQMLETIRSRCVCLTLEPVDWETAAPLLRRRLPGVDDEQLRTAHGLFGGTIGRTIEGVSDGGFRRVLELAPQMAAAVIDRRELTLLRLTAPLEKDKELITGVLAALRLIFRDALTLRYGGTTMLSTAPDEARLLAGRLNGARLMALSEETEKLENAARRNMNNTLLLTRICARLRQAAGN